MQFYCGIDLGARKTHVCVIDEDDYKRLDLKMSTLFFRKAEKPILDYHISYFL